jgi:hypothetical protein
MKIRTHNVLEMTNGEFIALYAFDNNKQAEKTFVKIGREKGMTADMDADRLNEGFFYADSYQLMLVHSDAKCATNIS